MKINDHWQSTTHSNIYGIGDVVRGERARFNPCRSPSFHHGSYQSFWRRSDRPSFRRRLHRIHGNTTHLWPAVPLHSVLVEGSAGLEDRLVDPATSSNTSNHGTVGRGDNLLGARG